jgi:hypothetical protein
MMAKIGLEDIATSTTPESNKSHICNAIMVEGFDLAVIEPLRHPAPIGEAGRHLIDDLLAFVGKRGRYS